MIQNPKEMLDDYLMGKLSPEQVNNFEAMLQSDPILANEASIQKDIIAGISDARRAALKARLNNIQIPKKAWYTNPRIVGFAAAAYLLALLAFLLYPNTLVKLVLAFMIFPRVSLLPLTCTTVVSSLNSASALA